MRPSPPFRHGPPIALFFQPFALVATGCVTEKVIVRERVIYMDRDGNEVAGTEARGGPHRPGSIPPPPQREAPPPPPPPEPPPKSLEAVIDVAREHVGSTTINVRGTPFRYDCSNFIRGMFSVLDVDLFSLSAENTGANGVTLIFKFMERYGENPFRQLPSVGDVIYFDNTWDKNGNGRLDDPLTHVGLVESVDSDGTVNVVHRANRGIVRDAMNLLRPHDARDENGKSLNGYLRPKARRDPPGTPYLMAETFAGFGTLKQFRLMGERPDFAPVPSADEHEPFAELASLQAWIAQNR